MEACKGYCNIIIFLMELPLATVMASLLHHLFKKSPPPLASLYSIDSHWSVLVVSVCVCVVRACSTPYEAHLNIEKNLMLKNLVPNLKWQKLLSLTHVYVFSLEINGWQRT